VEQAHDFVRIFPFLSLPSVRLHVKKNKKKNKTTDVQEFVATKEKAGSVPSN
jgi:hypothetical protein